MGGQKTQKNVAVHYFNDTVEDPISHSDEDFSSVCSSISIESESLEKHVDGSSSMPRKIVSFGISN